MTIIVPMFIAAEYFYTAPFKRRYKSRFQILIAPIAIIPLFFFTNYDVAILSAFVLLLYVYIAGRTLDIE